MTDPDESGPGAAASAFSRPIPRRELTKAKVHEIDEAASPEECAALARVLGLEGLSKLRIQGRLSAAEDGGWRFRGSLGASVVQACVVTLEPVRTRIDVAVRRDYVVVEGAEGPELDLDPDAPDEWEPMPRVLDPGVLAVEELVLALPAFPRAEGVPPLEAEARPRGAAPLAPGTRPFAALAALKEKLDDGDG